MKLRFLIATPKYDHKIGGVMALHNLCDALNRVGYEAAIVFFGGGPINFNWAYSNHPDLYHPNHLRVELSMSNPNEAIKDFLKNGVVIYPEIVQGNPLGASRVVKYLLYTDENYARNSPNEYVLSFSKAFNSNPDSFLFQSLSDLNFHSNNAPHWSKRTMDITYFGKGPKFTDCFKINDTLMLSRTWPEDKNQLGILLRQCRYFFTWDCISQTNIDALLCGAVPVFLHSHQGSIAELNEGELGAYPNIQLPDKLNKDSVTGLEEEIDYQMNEMKSKNLWFQNTWKERVLQFAIHVNNHFLE